MLRDLRKTVIARKDNKSLDDFVGKKSRKFYLETHYEKNFLYKYLLFLRKNGADINKFFDEKLQQNENKK